MIQTTASATITDDVQVPKDLVDVPLVRLYFYASLAYLLIAMMAGYFYGLQFIQHNPLDGIEIFSPGRWRMIHTQGVAYGFIANAFLGALHWAVPRLTLRPVLNSSLSWFIFIAWQAVVLTTVVGILAGHAQPLEWGETPTYVDPVATLGLILVAINFLPPIFSVKGPMYVTLWYFIAAFIWTILVYAMGNFIPEYVIGGSAAGAIGGLFIHDLVGLFVTPIGWGLMYYFVPIILKKPIRSHGLSLVGFWGLAFFYPLNGIHHFLYSPIPMFLQYGAVISTIAIELVVTTVIINFFGTLRNRGDMLRTSMPVRWFYIGMVFYFTTCLQCAFQTTLTFQKIIHFTDWVVGHAHLVMFGVFGFWILGFMTYLIPRLVGASGWYKDSLNEWHFWLTGISMLIMFFDLMIAGLIQGFSWRDMAPWEDSIIASIPFWGLRSIVGTTMLIGQFMFVYNVIMTALHKGPATKTTGTVLPYVDTSDGLREIAMFETKSGITLIAGIFFFFLAFVVMGLLPILIYFDEHEATVEELASAGILHEFVELREKFPEQFKEHYGEVSEASYAEALRLGHKVYVAEACWHCHSQQIRPVSNEDIRWGPVSHSREYQNELQRPVLFGTRRVGPDLIREGARKSNDWHLAHFYEPRSVVPVTVMPSYKWFYDDSGYPNKRGMAIITYVQWLGSWLDEYPYYQGEGPEGLLPDDPSPQQDKESTTASSAEEGRDDSQV